MNKIVSLNILKKILKSKHGGKTIVFTNGCFDILHYGHVRYLTAAKDQGDILIVGLNTDKSTRRLKGNSRPVNPQKDRAAVLSALQCVDYVILFDEDTPYKLIAALKPDILVKGSDWCKKKIIGRDVVLSRGGKVVTIPFVKNRSTTSIIKKILDCPKTSCLP